MMKANMFLQKVYFNKSELEKVMMMSAAFSIILAFFRVVYTGQLMFLFLIWNLFLAFIPFAITKYLMLQVQWIEKTNKFIVAFFLWLLFIPNSFYIITDLVHLENRFVVPLWFDLALILSFVWNGLLLGIVSVRQMEKIVAMKFNLNTEWFLAPCIMWLSAFGIYIGRYLRFNSWDVVTNPFPLIQNIIYLCIHPVRNRFDWSMIICFSILLTVFYLTLKRLSKEIN